MHIRLGCFLLVGAFLATVPVARAETIVFDFADGPGPSFTTINDGGLYTLDLDGPTFRVSKGADSGAFEPNGFVSGGIRSIFELVGDFTVTVDFTLNNFPAGPSGTVALNESLLSVVNDSDPSHGEAFSVLRYTVSNTNYVEVYGSPGGQEGLAPSSLVSGRYRLVRSGTTLTGLIASGQSDTFVEVGSLTGFSVTGYHVQLAGTQGTDLAGRRRSTTPLDISFDNLVIEAQGVTGLVPEPSTLLSAALGLAALAGYTGWRRISPRRR